MNTITKPFVEGFVAKCMEAELTEKQAAELLVAAQRNELAGICQEAQEEIDNEDTP